jgi:Tol biopolymer transport system component
MPRIVLVIGSALAGGLALVILLALVVSRALPGLGAIGYLWYRDGGSPDIYMLDIGLGTLHNLTHNNSYNGNFAFSPDGRRIVFESSQSGNIELYTIELECAGLMIACGGLRQLTDNLTFSQKPVWSPDSQQIAFEFIDNDESGSSEIFVLDTRSGITQNLSNHPMRDISPTWSPDGSRIAFASDRDTNYDIYATRPDGSSLERLTTDEAADFNPVWSPDGTRIAFVSDRSGVPEVFIMNANGGGLYGPVTGGIPDGNPGWTPDGAGITFVTVINFYPVMYTMHLEENRLHDLDFSNWEGKVSWSPDALWRVAVSRQTDNPEIYIMDEAGNPVRQLTYGGSVSSPMWWP